MCTPEGNAFTTHRFSLQVARQLQPSVVWIGDTEKTFYKKVPNAERKVRASHFLMWPFPSSTGAPYQGLPLSFKTVLVFQGRKETEGQPSHCPKHLTAFERIQCLILRGVI